MPLLPCPPLQAFGDRRGSSARNCMKEMIWGDGSGGKSNRKPPTEKKDYKEIQKKPRAQTTGKGREGTCGTGESRGVVTPQAKKRITAMESHPSQGVWWREEETRWRSLERRESKGTYHTLPPHPASPPKTKTETTPGKEITPCYKIFFLGGGGQRQFMM